MVQSNKLSFAERIVYAILEDNVKGTLNAQRLHSRIPRDAKINKEQVYKTLLLLFNKGLIDQPSKGNFSIAKPTETVEGIVELTRRGDFVFKNDDADIFAYIPDSLQRGLLPLDEVEVIIKKSKTKNHVVDLRLKQRKPRRLVGHLDLFRNHNFFIPSRDFPVDIKLNHSVDEEYDGYKAVVELIDWPKGKKNPVGKLVQVLGPPGETETEMHSIASEFGFELSFPEDAENEAAAFSDQFTKDEIKLRRDFRNILCITIDPADAKDFDDAISYQKFENGDTEIGVHIADVSHYVTENSALDQEAVKRGTSVYLADRTIPMLPEKLSNGLCSLNPNVDRLSFSVVYTLDADYKIKDTWIGKGIIHSKRRFSYEEAQERIISGEGDLQAELRDLNKIAQYYEKIRFQRGALRFESKEIRFKLDNQGNPIEATVRDRFEAHKLIETYMLMANQSVAEFVRLKEKPPIPFIYRSHDAPAPDRLMEFAKFCDLMGYPIQIDNENVMRKSFNDLMAKIEGDPSLEILQQMAIRTMAKAIYTSDKTSHFGLAFHYYTHFTSPIRRYPDLLAHRLLQSILTEGNHTLPHSQIDAIAKHSSNMEQKAVEAERASSKHMMARLMEQHKGEVLEAVITGVTEWGIYATVIKYHGEGLIRVSDIKSDKFQFVESEKKLMGIRTRKSFHLGDRVWVKVKQTDAVKRIIDFYLIED